MRLKRQAVLGPQMPIFVPLDKMSRKNLGYQVANLKELSEWNESFTRNRVKAVGATDNFFERVRQELSDRVGVDVAKAGFRVQNSLVIWANGDFSIWRLHPAFA